MTAPSNTDSNDELEIKVNGLIIHFMYVSEEIGKPIITIYDMRERLGALDETFLSVDIIKFYNETDYIEIIPAGDFTLTGAGRKKRETD